MDEQQLKNTVKTEKKELAVLMYIFVYNYF